MAPPSPRRSSRARAPNSQSHQSSGSSSTSGRIERSARLLHKPSPGISTPSASLSSEPLEDFEDTLLGRRRKRGQDDDLDKLPQVGSIDMANVSEDVQDDEDEAVRCLCGSEEYPGRPPLDGPDVEVFATVDLTEDVTGFFVQCDICKVWQHGACVGIFSADTSPDEYFCEHCRKDLHKIHIASNGQKYSKYFPLYQTSRATSLATSVAKEGVRSPKVGAVTRSARPESQSGKRRSTMNSRDAAYDDELLRRVIEASKEEVQDTVENSTRRAKRGRSDSEEMISSVKRQRTSSRSASPPAEQLEDRSRDDSEDEVGMRSASKKLRISKPPPEKTEKEERELQRQEAANKRKGRAERRRAEDSDPSDDMPLAASKAAATASVEPPNAIEASETAAQVPLGTPPPNPPAVGSSHKRGARSNHKKSKGKNQYTKDRDADNDESPARSMSRDIQKNMDEPAAALTAKSAAGDHHKAASSKSRLTAPGKMSMLDMKRRVAAIMDFISRTQVDLAAEAAPNPDGEEDEDEDDNSPRAPAANGGGSEKLPETGAPNGVAGGPSRDKDFKDLNCIEMMDVLARDMVKWQNQYA